MKPIVLSITVLFLLFSSFLKAQTPVFSEAIRFEEKIFDFGKINEVDGVASHIFKFKNTSKEPVFINAANSGCSCVQFEFSKEPVRANGTGWVKVSYNPAYRPGFFSKEIVVLSNNNAAYTRIWVKGTVNPYEHPVEENYSYNYGNGLWMNLKVLAFGTVQVNERKTIKLKYANDSDRDINLTFVTVGGNADIHYSAPRLVKAKERGEMNVTYYCTKPLVGMQETSVYPVVDDKALNQPLKVIAIGK